MPVFQKRYPYKRDPKIIPPIKPLHAQSIGYIAVHWSFVEESLSMAIGLLLNLPPTTRDALTAEITTLNQMTIIRALIECSADAELLSEWDSLRTEMDRLRPERNDAVHAAWQVVEPGHYARRTKAKSSFRVEFGPVATEELMKLSDDIMALSEKLVSFNAGIIHSTASKKLGDHLLPVPQAPVQNPRQLVPSQALKPKVRRQRLSSAQRRAMFSQKKN